MSLYIKDATGKMDVSELLNALAEMSKAGLGARWQNISEHRYQSKTRQELIVRILVYKIQEQAFAGFNSSIRRRWLPTWDVSLTEIACQRRQPWLQ